MQYINLEILREGSFSMAQVEETKKLVEDTFYWLHRHPELSYEEFETTKRLSQVLTSVGVKILDSGLATGLVAEVGEGEDVVALRADIDALPITEETGLLYASEVAGHMHACGHDFHTSALLVFS